MDGLDEWADPLKKTVLPVLLPCYSKCTVLTTTRHWKMTDERMKDSQIDCLLELEGVNDPHQFSKQILSCIIKEELESNHHEFVEYVKTNNLNEFYFTPVLLASLVVSWLNGMHIRGSRCEVYISLLDCLLKKSSISSDCFVSPPAYCFSETRYVCHNIELVHALSEIAFTQLFTFKKENLLVFTEKEEAILKPEQKTLALKTGILSERKSSTLTGISTLSFIHKSVQELLAAFHIARHNFVIEAVIEKYFDTFPDAYLDLSQVFIFLCGLNIKAANDLSRVIDQHTDMTDINVLPSCRYSRIQDLMTKGYTEGRANNHKDDDIRLNLSNLEVLDR
ncbi:hypothetical protein DPMN_055252 [Dreissena polymorpha]|uniref:NACHT domain-containing protein n=2 Tax=Dreissena polymorpha TaxID=45954 RepID=A0A9D4CRA3_DREPO|nr:hypothetical protein DPMN_055252 [Dreissena polymorpha]